MRKANKKLLAFLLAALGVQSLLLLVHFSPVEDFGVLVSSKKHVRTTLQEIANSPTFYPRNANSPIHQADDDFPSCAYCINGTFAQSSNRAENYEYFTGKYKLDASPVTASYVYAEGIHSFCDGKVVVFNDVFAVLHDVTLHPDRRTNAQAQSKGGEEIRDVLHQTLDKEDYKFREDFFTLSCADTMTKPYSKMAWIKSIRLNEPSTLKSNETYNVDKTVHTIAIRRQDYANLHNWVRNIYNSFLIMMHLKLQPANVSILFMDGHPFTPLDNAWETIYSKPLRVGRLETPIKYHNFILGFEENLGPVSNAKNKQVPFLEEFRAFVLSRFDLKSDVEIECYKLKITIIIRRNAVYHPRNVKGEVGRKIFNEAELTNALMQAYPRACVKAVLMESLSMKAQLDVIRQTDILIGMHGAGMSHTIFLPRHAGILELFAKDFKKGRPWYRCFQSIAEWRNMKYETWENFDKTLEMPSDFTIVPVDIVLEKTRLLVQRICPNV